MTRLFTGSFGVAALVWTLYAAPMVRASVPFEALTRQITAGEVFPDDRLMQAAELHEALPVQTMVYATRARGVAILRLRLVESALDRVDPRLDGRLATLHGALREALASNPADPFLWLTQYWLDNTQSGFSPDHLAALTNSYALGPREGWIAQRRERLALVVFAQLDAATQARVVDEFAAMADAHLTDAVAENLIGPGWPLRDRLVASLVEVDPAAKQGLARYLFNQGIPLAIPGAPNLGDRPWQ